MCVFVFARCVPVRVRVRMRANVCVCVHAFVSVKWPVSRNEAAMPQDMGLDTHTTGNSWMMRILTSVIPYHADAKGHQFIEYMDGKAG